MSIRQKGNSFLLQKLEKMCSELGFEILERESVTSY